MSRSRRPAKAEWFPDGRTCPFCNPDIRREWLPAKPGDTRRMQDELDDLASEDSRADIDRELDAMPEYCTRECCRRED